MAVEIALGTRARVGEGPTWDPATGELVWVDIVAAEVHRTDVATGSDTVLRTPQHVGAAKPRAGGGLVVVLRDGVAVYDPDAQGDQLRWLARWARPGLRGNDAAVDAAGRLWAGTMAYDETPGAGTLYRVGSDGTLSAVVDQVTISNGIGWSPDGRRMYYVDSPTRRIDVFDVVFDAAGGDGAQVARRRPFAYLPADMPGVPDGLAVDAEGHVWVAVWDGAAVLRFDPDGHLAHTVDVPVTRPTACAFGGPDLTDLYITSARVGLPAEVVAREPAGALLIVPDAGHGLPGTPFAG